MFKEITTLLPQDHLHSLPQLSKHGYPPPSPPIDALVFSPQIPVSKNKVRIMPATYEYDHVLEGLEELSNKDLQEKLWINGTYDCMSTSVEAFSHVFDTTLGQVLRFEVSEIESHPFIDLGRALRSLVHEIDQDQSDRTIIDSELMIEVRQAAQRLREMLIELGRDEYNRMIPTGQAGLLP